MWRKLWILCFFGVLCWADSLSEDEKLARCLAEYQKTYTLGLMDSPEGDWWKRILSSGSEQRKNQELQLLQMRKEMLDLNTRQLSPASLEDWFFFLYGNIEPRLVLLNPPSQAWLDTLQSILVRQSFSTYEEKFSYFADLKAWVEAQDVPDYFVVQTDAPRLKKLLQQLAQTSKKAIEGIETWAVVLNSIQTEAQKHLELAIRRAQNGYQKHAWLLKYYYFMDENADELLKLGEQSFQETWTEIQKLAHQIDPLSSPEVIFQKMRKLYPPQDQVIETCRILMEEALRFVQEKDLMTVPKKALYLPVIPVTPRSNMPYAFYQPLQAYCVPIQGLNLSPERLEDFLGDFNFYRISVIALHEAYPGHHLQYSKAVPSQRKTHLKYFNPFYVEGWGFYCEELMDRHGYYRNPLLKMAQLKMKLWRSARVILDLKIHIEGWKVKEAAKFLEEKVFLSAEGALQEATRYSYSPIQPLSYVIGSQKIEALYAEFREKKGLHFSEKKFYDQFLTYGSLPLKLVRLHLLQWAEQP